MKRRALLIGNSNGLAGVKLDISNYVKFLTSDFGGQWYNYEIIIKMNPSRIDLLNTIRDLRNENPDFAFIAFSGHGAYAKSTLLEINNDKEYILEENLIGIAKRQISIFDCCRNIISTESLNEDMKFKNLSDSINAIRNRYEHRILQAIEQQVMLYACSINESSLDTYNGGLYTYNLLDSIRPANSNQYKLVGETHEEAAEKTRTSAWINHLHRQNPTAILPRCLSSQQLIFSINPYL